MKKIILGIVAVIIIVIASHLWRSNPIQNNNSDSSKPTIKIGTILPLTGGMGNLVEPGNHGALLAVEELNANPDNKYRYELISEDTAMDAKRAIPIYKKMVHLDKVSAIISFDSQAALVIKPLAEQDKILHISAAADPAAAGNEHNFRYFTDMGESVDKLLQYFEKMGYRKIAIASINYTTSKTVLEILKNQAKNFGIETVVESLVNPNERQLQSEAYKIVQSNPDVVFLYGFEPVISLYARELKNAGYKGAISGINTPSYSEHPELLEGGIYLDCGTGTEAFKEKYRQKFGTEPNTLSPVMFDSVNIIARMHESGTQKPGEILPSYIGQNGKLIMKPGGLIHADLVFVRMTNGKPIPVKE